ncbi:MAG: DUF4173 domain-containing protein [Oscillospiraceae bacterium]|nr:DUF4173 domain-containing protein [Oscillospiraceae bacterium]
MNETNGTVSGEIPVYTMPQPECIPIIKPKEYSLKEIVSAFAAMVAGFVFIKCAAAPFRDPTCIGFGASLAMILMSIYCIIWTKKNDAAHIFRMVLALAFSVNTGICSMWLIQLLDAVFAAMILVYDRFAVSDESVSRIRKNFFSDLITAFCVQPLENMGEVFGAVRSGTKGRTGSGVKNVVIGLFFALPATIVVAILLSSADDGFARIMEELFDNAFARIFICLIQILLGIPAAMYLYGACYASSHRDAPYEEDSYIKDSARIIPAAAGVISAVPLCAMYVIFFCSQLSHYLSSFVNVLPTGETYAAYARQGFFELCVVALINLGMIAALNIMCARSEGKKAASVRIMTIVLCVFTLMLIATALAKMAMYINVYGLTQLRTYTSWFMILLALIFVIIAVSTAAEKLNAPRLMAAVFTVMFAVLSFANTDGLIARYNMERYLDGSLPNLNISSMSELSSDAHPALRSYSDRLSPEDRKKIEDITAHTHRSDDWRTNTLNDIIADIANNTGSTGVFYG